MQGFDIDPSPGQWRVGDRVLLGIRVTRAGVESTLYMTTEIVGTPEFPPAFTVTTSPQGRPRLRLSSPTCATRIMLYDEHGTLIQETKGRIPTMILNCGPSESALGDLRAQEEIRNGAKHEDVAIDDRAIIGFMAFLTFGQSSGKNRVMSDLVGRIVQRPSIISLVIDPSLWFGWKDGGPTAAPQETLGSCSLPAYTLPMEVRAAGRPVASTDITVVPATPPIGICGGVVRADVRHPSEPGTFAQVRLLAARRDDGADFSALEPFKETGVKD
jgi:hypothetical protein